MKTKPHTAAAALDVLKSEIRKLGPAETARRANVPRSTIQRIIHGTHNPTLENFDALLHVFKLRLMTKKRSRRAA